MCVHVCVCERKTQTDRETKRQKEGGVEGEREECLEKKLLLNKLVTKIAKVE